MDLPFKIPDLSNPIYRTIQLFWRMIIFSYRAQKKISTSLFRSVFHAFKLYFKDDFNPRDAYLLGFLSKGFVYGSHKKYISKRKMAVIQHKVNPGSWELLTEDKGVFYQICEKSDIPTPRLYGLMFKATPGWSFLGSKAIDRKDWNDFAINSLPEAFVVKPARGAYGEKIKIFKRSGDAFIDEKKDITIPGDIYDFMVHDPVYDCFVIQERLFNHRDLVRLSGSEFLQTMRMITHIRKNGDIKIVDAFLKPIVGNNYTDNHDHGKTGNLLARINMDTGLLQPAIILGSAIYGRKSIVSHPDTGVLFSEFTIPGWKYACDLALSAARQFAPLRTIGWDLAITPNGACIIEGNFTYDPPIFGDIDVLLNELNTSIPLDHE
jgi:hypothetical protein